MTRPDPHAAAAPPLKPPRRAGRLGALLLADALLAFTPVVILGPSIGWPASLDAPAAQQLAAIAAAPEAVARGYGAYLLYSLLVVPVMAGLAARSFDGLHRPLAAVVVAFAAISGLARAIGIVRWLTVMPVLAAAHGGADPLLRAQVALVFDALNAYGGGIGELLGVSLTMAVSLGAWGAGAWQAGVPSRRAGGAAMPRWLAGSALAVAGVLAGLSAGAIGLPFAPPMALAVTALSLWMVAAGVWCLRRGG